MITETENQKNMYNMYHKYKCASIYKRNFEGVSEIGRKIRIKGVCTKQNRSVVRGSNVIMSDFY